MKQVVIRRGEAAVEEAPLPPVLPGRVVVDVAWSMLSPGTEIYWLDNAPRGVMWRVRHRSDGAGRVWRRLREEGGKATWKVISGGEDSPTRLGYSCTGVVREVGAGVSDIAVGSTVACVGPGYASHAEVVSVPRNLVAVLPDSVALRGASSIALGGIAIHALRRADARLGETVAVIGLGVIGQLVVQLLAAAGCNVIAIDPRPERTDRVSRFAAQRGDAAGIRCITAPADRAAAEAALLAGPSGIDSAMVATGEVPGIVQAASEMVRSRGRLVLVGLAAAEMSRKPSWLKELDLVVSRSYGPGYDDQAYEHGADYPLSEVRWPIHRNLDAYVRQLAAGRVDPDLLIDREFPIELAPRAYAALRREEPTPIGVVLRYPFADRLG